jgi:hypothetical protein
MLPSGIATITDAQAIRLPGEALNNIQIDGVDRGGHSVRITLLSLVS